jgi:hypothetical protein
MCDKYGTVKNRGVMLRSLLFLLDFSKSIVIIYQGGKLVGLWNRVVFSSTIMIIFHTFGIILTIPKGKKVKLLIAYFIPLVIISFIGFLSYIIQDSKAQAVFPSLVALLFLIFVAVYAKLLYFALRNIKHKDMFIMLFPIIASHLFFAYCEVERLFVLPLEYFESSFEYLLIVALLSGIYISSKLTRSGWSVLRFFMVLFFANIYIFFNNILALIILNSAVVILALVAGIVKENKGISAVLGEWTKQH